VDNQRKYMVLGAIAVIAVLAWMGRYEVTTSGVGGESSFNSAYLLDRWTGDLYLVERNNKFLVEEIQVNKK
jgi:thioredoxin reductase